jgi:Pyridoxamine 5'-phosphate oxidase
MLEWTWAEDRLADAHNYWVATSGPHASPVWGLWQDGGVLFSCGPRSRKARALTDDARIVVHLESGADTVIVEGVAERAPATDAHLAAYEAKYEYRASASEAWYRVTPNRAFAWREADYPRAGP